MCLLHFLHMHSAVSSGISTFQLQVFLETTAAALTLQIAEVGCKRDDDGSVWTAETKAFSPHQPHCRWSS